MKPTDSIAAQVYLYNVYGNEVSAVLDPLNGLETISTRDNEAATMNGYNVRENLYRVSRTRFVSDDTENADWSQPEPTEFRACDLGITIIMMAFAKYYARKQYPILVNALKTVRELELLEKFLLSIGSVKFEPNLALHSEYGLLANRNRWTGSRYLRIEEFESICSMLRSSHTRAEEFVENLIPFNRSIVESFYMFCSVTRDVKMITECRVLSCPRFVYTFDRPTRSERYDGRFWFRVPPRSTWFAYSQGRWSFQTYLGRDAETSMKRLDGIKALVVGFVHERALYPVFVDHPLFVGRWAETMCCFAALGFPIVLRDDTPGENLFSFYFVKDGDGTLYRYHRSRATEKYRIPV